jgi:hypothetical protein
MTDLLNKAFSVASQLPADQQNSLAAWLLAELESERRWDESFAASSEGLAALAAEALAEHAAGRTQPLDPERL